MWFLAALEEGPSYTTVALVLRLKGSLDGAALARALQAVVARHEALRTVYRVVDGVAVQQVAAAARFALAHEEAIEAELAARLEGLARHRFDLARDLPVRAVLLRLGAVGCAGGAAAAWRAVCGLGAVAAAAGVRGWA